MKNIFAFATFLLPFIISSCDAPQQTRYSSASSYNGTQGSFGDGAYFDGSSEGSGQKQNDDSGQQSGGQASVQDKPGFENCNLGHRYHGGSIGEFGLCQNSKDQRQFSASFAMADLNVGTCFVPMHASGSKSFNVGRPECVHNKAGQTYYMTLYKSRYEPINAVMVIRYSSLNSFMQCMSAQKDFIAAHPGCSQSPTCIQQANTYANSVCSQFAQTHSSHYKQVIFGSN